MAPPGFINVRLAPEWKRAQVDAIVQAGPAWGDIDLGRGESVSTVHSGSVSVESGAVFQLCDGEGIHIAESPWLRGGWGLLCDGGSLGDSAVRIHQGDRAVSLPVERVTMY